MKTKPIGLILALSLLAGGVSLAADPQLGTWKLNEGKSKFTPGTTKNTKVVYEAVGDSIRITADGIDSRGKPTHSQWTGKFDGKDYPANGDPNFSARAYKRINDRTLEMTMTRKGYEAGKGRIVVSADGKSRTVTTSGSDAHGTHFKNTAVFDKQ